MSDPFAQSAPVAEAPPAGFDPSAAAGSAEEIAVDFSGTSDDFVQLENGWYLFSITKATARTDDGGPLLSQSGNPMILWVNTVVEGPRAGSPMFMRTVTTGAGAFGLRRFINNAFGSKLGKEPMTLALGPFIGKKFWGEVGPQKNDASFQEFKKFRPENDPPPSSNGAPTGIGSKI